MKNLTLKLLLLAIVLLAGVLRFYNISETAPTLNWDEAALGYNAYSLGIDGRDEFGKFLPVQYLESFGDYKPVLYSYLGIIPVKIFGLNEFGVRFPSAILGTLTILLTFFLVREIFPKKSREIDLIALTSSFILAISPWHIMLSRGAYEANVSTFFIVLGIWLFLRGINRNLWLLIPSAIFLAISFYTFNTARIFVPLIVIALGFGFRKTLLKDWKKSVTAALVGLVILLPLIPFLLSPQAKLRFEEVNIFSDLNIIKTSNQYVENDNGVWWSKIIHNRRVLYGLEFTKHYFDNLNPGFLFITGDGNPRFSTQDVGQLYLIELPFLIVGVFLLFKKREGNWWIIPVWLILGIIPAATARETPHALRIETVIPVFQIIVAYGLVNLILLIKNKNYQKIIAVGLAILFILSLGYFYHGLIRHYAREYSSEWQYPYEEAVRFVLSQKENYDRIVVTEKLGRPYIYFLLYGKIDPRQFRESANVEREVFGFVHVNGFDKYRFVKETAEKELIGRTLFIDIPKEETDDRVLKTFKYLDGKSALVAYEKNK